MKAVQYFCVAARTLSFKDAAEQLSVTPGAVSQQIKLLENWLGFQVFERETRALKLTSLGNTYFRRVSPQLQELLGVTHSMRQLTMFRPVHIALPPSFEIVCFVPKLNAILESFPQLEIRTKTSQLPATLRDDGTEIAIRYLSTPDPGLECHKLVDLQLMPVCSPSLLARNPGLQCGDFDGITLIHNILHPDWHLFSNSLGIDFEVVRNYHCEQSLSAIEAAKRGVGIALIDSLMAKPFIDSGELIHLGNHVVKASRDLYLVHSNRHPLTPQASELKKFLIRSFKNVTD